MNLPPALTWLQLFPKGIGISCAPGVPQWLYDMLANRPGVESSSPRVLAAVRIITALLFIEHGLMKLAAFPAAVPGLPTPLRA